MKKPIPMPVVIAAALVVLALLGYFVYRATAPAGYVTTKETGKPKWVQQWEKDHPGQGFQEPKKN